MIPLKEIKICKADAINYYKGGDKAFLQKIFFNDTNFQEILDRKRFFLLGDKGTGKTAYAVYCSNNESPILKTCLKFTNETDFKKFIRLIDAGKINVSDFVNVWKVIFLLLISQEIKSNLEDSHSDNITLLSQLDKAINKYYESAFSPEITNAIEIVDRADTFLEILKNLDSRKENLEKISTSGFQINLFEIEKEFMKALKNISLKKNFILFIDGTDQIPFDIKKINYIECLKGMANAIWDLNQLIFPDILPNDKFFLKIVLLIRPDIFSIIKFHNANAKLKDNSVLLNWITKESNWKRSKLFRIADNLFVSQQSSKYILGVCWNEYCDEIFELNVGGKNIKYPSFVAVLNRTFMRPRDIFTFLDIMHREAINRNLRKITSQIFNNSHAEFSRYLLGEIKDQFDFFHDDYDWEILLDFFKYFEGRTKFNYKFFLSCFNRYIEDYPKDNPDVFDHPEFLLQELYENNIICYIEETSNGTFYRWAYKEKNYTNLYPTVVYDSMYQIHYGLVRALGLGGIVTRRKC